MLSEGTIIKNYMLTRVLSKTPLACLFQSINVDTGERYLTKVARTTWLDTPGTIQSLGFDFRPGQSLPWKPTPSDIIETECEFLDQIKEMQLALPRPVEWGYSEDSFYVTYEFFDGVSLDEVFESGTGFTIQILIGLLEEVDRLSVHGISHGNLQPSTILVGQGSVLLTDITHPITVRSSRQHKRLLRCITVPEFYPFLDPSQDQLAMGILLYTLVTGKHPLALEEIARNVGAARRAGLKFSQLVDDARERGANRFLSPLLSFMNPIQVKKGASEDFQELVLRTLGFSRSDLRDDGGRIEVLPDTWLDNALEGNTRSRDNFWTLSDTADALAQIFSEKDSAPEKSEEAPTKPKRKTAGKSKSAKAKALKQEEETAEPAEPASREAKEPDIISFEPEENEVQNPPSPDLESAQEVPDEVKEGAGDDLHLPDLYIPANGDEEPLEVVHDQDEKGTGNRETSESDPIELQDDQTHDAEPTNDSELAIGSSESEETEAESSVEAEAELEEEGDEGKINQEAEDDDEVDSQEDDSSSRSQEAAPIKHTESAPDLDSASQRASRDHSTIRSSKSANTAETTLPSLSFEDSQSDELEIPGILPAPVPDDDRESEIDERDFRSEEQEAGESNESDVDDATDLEENEKADETAEDEQRQLSSKAAQHLKNRGGSPGPKEPTVMGELLAELVSMAESDRSSNDERQDSEENDIDEK